MLLTKIILPEWVVTKHGVGKWHSWLQTLGLPLFTRYDEANSSVFLNFILYICKVSINSVNFQNSCKHQWAQVCNTYVTALYRLSMHDKHCLNFIFIMEVKPLLHYFRFFHFTFNFRFLVEEALCKWYPTFCAIEKYGNPLSSLLS